MTTVQLQIRDRQIAVSREAALLIAADPAKADLLYECATDFGRWLDYWPFLNGETGKRQLLGPTLFCGQRRFVQALQEHEWVLSLKARKLGLTTLECAFDAWVVRFRPDSFVAAISYRQEASNAIRTQVLDGLQSLPPWLALPVRKTTTSVTLEGGGHLEAHPATERAAVDRSATHVHLDELARCINPANLWQAIQPSAAGTLHCLTTSLGPESYAAELWRRTELGETRLHPVFISALEREGRNEAWHEQMKRDLGSARARLEYPLVPEDALAGLGDRFFDPATIDRATVDAYPLRAYTSADERPARFGHLRPRYVAGIDIGVRDAFCCVVLDTTEDVWDVAALIHETGLAYPQMCRVIEGVRNAYPGIRIAVEANNAGAAVIQHLRFPVKEWWTTAKTKSEALYNVQALLEQETLKISPEGERLLYELRLYQVPDTAIPQDAVMALAIAVQTAHTHRPGRASLIYA